MWCVNRSRIMLADVFSSHSKRSSVLSAIWFVASIYYRRETESVRSWLWYYSHHLYTHTQTQDLQNLLSILHLSFPKNDYSYLTNCSSGKHVSVGGVCGGWDQQVWLSWSIRWWLMVKMMKTPSSRCSGVFIAAHYWHEHDGEHVLFMLQKANWKLAER